MSWHLRSTDQWVLLREEKKIWSSLGVLVPQPFRNRRIQTSISSLVEDLKGAVDLYWQWAWALEGHLEIDYGKVRTVFQETRLKNHGSRHTKVWQQDSSKAMQRKMESSSESNRKAAHSSSPMVMLNSWTHRPPPPSASRPPGHTVRLAPSASRYLDTQTAPNLKIQDTWTQTAPNLQLQDTWAQRPLPTFSFKIPWHTPGH